MTSLLTKIRKTHHEHLTKSTHHPPKDCFISPSKIQKPSPISHKSLNTNNIQNLSLCEKHFIRIILNKKRALNRSKTQKIEAKSSKIVQNHSEQHRFFTLEFPRIPVPPKRPVSINDTSGLREQNGTLPVVARFSRIPQQSDLAKPS
jgi:hypothetical protein